MECNQRRFLVSSDVRVIHLIFLLVAYNCLPGHSQYFLSEAMVVSGAVALIAGHFRAYVAVLAALGAFLLVDLAANFYARPNQAFVVLLLTCLMGISVVFGQGKEFLAKYAALIFTVLMGAALVQKLLSVHYVSGMFMLTRISEGYMLSWLLQWFNPDWLNMTREFSDHLIDEVAGPANRIGLETWGSLHIIALGMTYISLIFQLSVEMIVIQRKRFEVLVGPAVLFFVFSVYLVVPANAFLCMSLFMGLCMIDREKYQVQYGIFVVSIIYMTASNYFWFRPFFLT